MAEFCKDCSKRLLGIDTSDFDGLCKPDEVIHVLCEGCGDMIWVDHTGAKIKE